MVLLLYSDTRKCNSRGQYNLASMDVLQRAKRKKGLVGIIMDNGDPLKKLYEPLPELKPSKESTALLIIDMQYLDAARGYGLFNQAQELGVDDAVEYYFNRIEEEVVPNIVKLQEFCRTDDIEILFTKIESLTKDGRDRSLEHKLIGVEAPKGSKEGKILEEIKPVEDEIVLPKTASGVFNATNIDYVLKNLGKSTLIMVGVVTNECVETAARDAADLSYNVIVVEDSCAALSEKYHENSIRSMKHTYARIRSTEEVIDWLQ